MPSAGPPTGSSRCKTTESGSSRNTRSRSLAYSSGFMAKPIQEPVSASPFVSALWRATAAVFGWIPPPDRGRCSALRCRSAPWETAHHSGLSVGPAVHDVSVFLQIFIENGECLAVPQNGAKTRGGSAAFQLDDHVYRNLRHRPGRSSKGTAGVVLKLHGSHRLKKLVADCRLCVAHNPVSSLP